MNSTAAKRAVFDAIHRSSLGYSRIIGKTADDMPLDVTIRVPKPAAWIARPFWKRCPTAPVTINVVHGGHQVLNEKADDG